jgi:hypothetical protein
MDQKEPIKIKLTGILRWIFGLFFIVIALGMIIEYEYFPAVFMFMAVFISFPPISNLIESEFNISLSDGVRLLLVIIILAGSFAVEPNYSSSAIIFAHTSSGSHNTTHDDNVCYWDWKWHETSQIKDVKAP